MSKQKKCPKCGADIVRRSQGSPIRYVNGRLVFGINESPQCKDNQIAALVAENERLEAELSAVKEGAETAREAGENMSEQNIKTEVMAIVAAIGDPLMEHIVHRMGHGPAATKDAVRELVQEGMLRMKEDTRYHDWAYRMTRRGREAYGYEKDEEK